MKVDGLPYCWFELRELGFGWMYRRIFTDCLSCSAWGIWRGMEDASHRNLSGLLTLGWVGGPWFSFLEKSKYEELERKGVKQS